MKLLGIVILVLSSLGVMAQEDRNGSIGISVSQPEEIGWPTDVKGLIDHLNEWDKDELDAYERPEAFPNFVTSGETNAWVDKHIEELLKLDATIVWNKKKKKYELVGDL